MMSSQHKRVTSKSYSAEDDALVHDLTLTNQEVARILSRTTKAIADRRRNWRKQQRVEELNDLDHDRANTISDIEEFVVRPDLPIQPEPVQKEERLVTPISSNNIETPKKSFICHQLWFEDGRFSDRLRNNTKLEESSLYDPVTDRSAPKQNVKRLGLNHIHSSECGTKRVHLCPAQSSVTCTAAPMPSLSPLIDLTHSPDTASGSSTVISPAAQPSSPHYTPRPQESRPTAPLITPGLPGFLQFRNAVMHCYMQKLSNIGVTLLQPLSTHYKVTMQVDS